MSEPLSSDQTIQFPNGYVRMAENGWLRITADGYGTTMAIGDWARMAFGRTQGPQPAPPLNRREVFPGMAGMFVAGKRMAVTPEWRDGWNACLKEIDRLGGFENG